MTDRHFSLSEDSERYPSIVPCLSVNNRLVMGDQTVFLGGACLILVDDASLLVLDGPELWSK